MKALLFGLVLCFSPYALAQGPWPYPAFLPERISNVIVAGRDFTTYLDQLKLADGGISYVSQYIYEMNYYISPNWTLPQRTPFAYANFSQPARKVSPGIKLTPVIAMGGSFAVRNFAFGNVFAEQYVAEAAKWGWDGYTMETEIKYTSSDAKAMAHFLTIVTPIFNAKNLSLAVITKSTFEGHRNIGISAVNLIIPTEYSANAKEMLWYPTDQHAKYPRTCGVLMEIFPSTSSAEFATNMTNVMASCDCHMLAFWADFVDLTHWYAPLKKWLAGS